MRFWFPPVIGAIVFCGFAWGAGQGVAEMKDCREGRIGVALGEGMLCLPDGEDHRVVADASGAPFSVHIKDFAARVAAGDVPHGVHDVAIIGRPFAPVDPQSLTPSPIAGVGELHDGRLRYLAAHDLAFFGQPFLLRCDPALAPQLAAQGAQLCTLYGHFDSSRMVEVRLTTVLWQDQAAWPALDATSGDTWPAPLAQLEHAISTFFTTSQ